MGCRAHLCDLPGLDQVGHSLGGNQWQCWDSGQEPNVVFLPVLLTPDVLFALKSDGPPHRWDFGSGWHFCQIFGSGWPLVRHTPQWRHLVAKSGTTSGQHDICSAFGSGWPLVRCIPLVEASGGQEWYYIRSAWHLVSLRVRLSNPKPDRLIFCHTAGWLASWLAGWLPIKQNVNLTLP